MTKVEGNQCMPAQRRMTGATALGRIAAAGVMLLLLTACAGQHTRLSSENRRSLAADTQLHAVHHKSMGSFSYESTGKRVAGALIRK